MQNFFKNKRVFVTGHTGFKGSWLCKLLERLEANVYGFSLPADANSNMFSICNFSDKLISFFGDIRDLNSLTTAFNTARPEIVFHLAAQPLVLDGYRQPSYTYETNVMGTVNILECIRQSDTAKSFVNITTDKVYQNNEWLWGYRETDVLNGYDPYSNSKSCSELVTDTYRRSFFMSRNVSISTARAGNVIGGGDFSPDRILPDCIRAASNKQPIILRTPDSIRPYQFVLEPLTAYLLIAQKQYDNVLFADSYNIGPDEKDCVTTLELVNLFCKHWGESLSIITPEDKSFHEANFLKLDSSKVKSKLNWKPLTGISSAVSMTVEFAKCYLNSGNINELIDKQIEAYIL